MNTFNEKSLKNYIDEAIDKLYKNDSHLIRCVNEEDKSKNKYHVSERSIVSRFGIYFEECRLKFFSEYDLDIEYNRDIYDCKRLAGKPVIPDLILHKRGTNENNLLVLEFKTWWNRDQNNDINKIKGFKKEYGYRYGAVILIGKTRKDCKVNWI